MIKYTIYELKRQTLLLSPDSAQDIIWAASLKPLNPWSLLRTSIIGARGNNRRKKERRNRHTRYVKAKKCIHKRNISSISHFQHSDCTEEIGWQNCSRLTRSQGSGSLCRCKGGAFGTHQASLFPPGISDGPYRAPSSPPLTPLPTNKIPLALRSWHRLYMREKEFHHASLKSVSPTEWEEVQDRYGDPTFDLNDPRIH